MQVRKLENVERRISRQKHHVRFSLRCRDTGITPPSLKVKCPIKTARAEQIVAKARKDLLRERIRLAHNSVKALEAERVRLREHLEGLLDRPTYDAVIDHTEKAREHTYEKEKLRHADKFTQLENRATPEQKAPVMSEAQLKRVVVNKSKSLCSPKA